MTTIRYVIASLSHVTRRWTPARRPTLLLVGLATTVGVLGACGGRHHLNQYDFSGHSLAVVYFAAPSPELRTGGYDVDTRDPLSAVVTAGGRVAREVEARQARERLATAADRLDLAARMAERSLERTSRYLGARPVEDGARADYLLEVDVRSLGLDARGERLHLFVSSEAVLLDARTGREIWASHVRSSDPLGADLGDGGVIGDVISAGTLHQLSVDDFEILLARLADYAADRTARELRSDLRSIRDR